MRKTLSTYLLLTALSAFLLCSCSDNDQLRSITEKPKVDLSEEEVVSIAFDHPRELSMSELYDIVADFICQDPATSLTRGSSALKFQVLSRTEITGARPSGQTTTRSGMGRYEERAFDTPVPCYELLAEDGGKAFFVLASADERAPGVLAYFPDFPISGERIAQAIGNPNTKAVLAMAKSQLAKDVMDIEHIREEYRESTIAKVCKALKISRGQYSFETVRDCISSTDRRDAFTRYSIYDPPTDTIVKMDIATPLRWDQLEPYNRALPMANVSYAGLFPEYKNIPAGCSVIALALLESIIQRPVVNGDSIDWDLLRADSVLMEGIWQPYQSPAETLDMAGNLIKGIYQTIRAFPDYDDDGYVVASAASVPNINNYIYNNFNSVSEMSFTKNSVVSSIDDGKPVFLGGVMYGDNGEGTNIETARHNFIIDGYIKRKDRELVFDFSLGSGGHYIFKERYYFHANLGWGPGSAAFFKYEGGTGYDIEYNDIYGRGNWIILSDQQIITDIEGY